VLATAISVGLVGVETLTLVSDMAAAGSSRLCRGLCIKLWRSEGKLSVYSLRVNNSMNCMLGVRAREFETLH